jgi:hypothetical protein
LTRSNGFVSIRSKDRRVATGGSVEPLLVTERLCFPGAELVAGGQDMKLRLLLIFLAVALFCPLAHADDVSKDLKSKLDERYKNHKVKIIPARILVSPFNPGFGKPEDINFYFHYDRPSPKLWEY